MAPSNVPMQTTYMRVHFYVAIGIRKGDSGKQKKIVSMKRSAQFGGTYKHRTHTHAQYSQYSQTRFLAQTNIGWLYYVLYIYFIGQRMNVRSKRNATTEISVYFYMPTASFTLSLFVKKYWNAYGLWLLAVSEVYSVRCAVCGVNECHAIDVFVFGICGVCVCIRRLWTGNAIAIVVISLELAGKVTAKIISFD